MTILKFLPTFDVRHIVALSDIDITDSSHHERKAGFDSTHF